MKQYTIVPQRGGLCYEDKDNNVKQRINKLKRGILTITYHFY